MTKRGFTLVELVAVIVVIGIIGIIAFPITDSAIKNSKQKSFNAQISLIIEASKKWGLKNTELLPDGNETTKVYLNTLIQEGFLKNDDNKDLINPVDKTVMDGCVMIKYMSDYNQYTYEYNEDC